MKTPTHNSWLLAMAEILKKYVQKPRNREKYLCLQCSHFIAYTEDNGEVAYYCTSFPKGIPDEIVLGKCDHRNVHPKQESQNTYYNTLEVTPASAGAPSYLHETSSDIDDLPELCRHCVHQDNGGCSF